MEEDPYDKRGNQAQDPSRKSNAWSSSSMSSNSTGGKNSSFNHGDDLDPALKKERDNGFKYNPNGDSAGASEGGATDGTGGVKAKGAAAGGGLANSDEWNSESGGRGNSTGNNKQRFRFTKKRAAIGGSAIVGVGGTGAVLFFMLIPLKIEHVVNNLQEHFFASSQSAVQSETQTMFEKYVVSRVIPGYSQCGSTLDRHCTANKFGSDPVANLYRTWSQNRLENTLAEKYGIEFQKRADGWYLKMPGVAGENIGKNGEKLSEAFNKVGFSEIHQAIKNETAWYQVLIRYKYGRFAEEKYGVKRCIIYCGIEDPLRNKIADQKIASKLYLVQRVIVPRTQAVGIALECLLSGCDPTTNNQPNADPNAPATNGEAGDQQVDTKISEGLRTLASGYGIVDEASLKALQDTYNKIADQGIQKWLITEGLQKAGAGSATSQFTADSVPIVGWVNLAANIVDTGNNAGPEIKKLRYAVNGPADVQLFMMYRTYADEIHTGHVTATEVGSMVKSLSSSASGGVKSQVGGTAGAEGSPLYQHLIDKVASPSTTTGSAKDYKCNNAKTIPVGKLICGEEALGGGNSFANTIHDFLNLPGLNVISTIAKLWHDTVGQAFNLVGDVFSGVLQGIAKVADAACKVPVIGTIVTGGYCQAKDLVSKVIPDIIKGVTEWLIPNPFSANMSGGRTFTLMAGGADVAGNAFAQNGIGGKALSPSQSATIINQQQSEDLQQFSHKSFFARMFSTDSRYSLVSRIAVDIPFNLASSPSNYLDNFVSNPFGGLSHAFSSILSKPASAATATESDAFGVTQYGYTGADIAAIGDPETFWNQNCVDDASQGYQKGGTWNQAAANTPDPSTGSPENTTTNPCELIKASVGAAGGKYDSSNLTTDDLADVNGGGTGGSTAIVSPSAGGGEVFPFPPQAAIVGPSSWTQDQGVDISTAGAACGKAEPEVAMGDGTIVSYGISGFGPDAPILHVTAGPLADRYIYYGHALARPAGPAGTQVKAGQVITYVGCGIVGISGGPHLEIGIWPKGSSPTSSFPAKYQTSAEMLQILTDSYKAQGSK